MSIKRYSNEHTHQHKVETGPRHTCENIACTSQLIIFRSPDTKRSQLRRLFASNRGWLLTKRRQRLNQKVRQRDSSPSGCSRRRRRPHSGRQYSAGLRACNQCSSSGGSSRNRLTGRRPAPAQRGAPAEGSGHTGGKDTARRPRGRHRRRCCIARCTDERRRRQRDSHARLLCCGCYCPCCCWLQCCRCVCRCRVELLATAAARSPLCCRTANTALAAACCCGLRAGLGWRGCGCFTLCIRDNGLMEVIQHVRNDFGVCIFVSKAIWM